MRFTTYRVDYRRRRGGLWEFLSAVATSESASLHHENSNVIGVLGIFGGPHRTFLWHAC